MDQKIEDLDNVELLEKYKSVIKAEENIVFSKTELEKEILKRMAYVR